MTRYLWLLLTPLAGCGTYATATPLNEPPHPMTPRAPETVEVFSSGPPPRAHADVALLEVEQYDRFDGGTPKILAELRKKAAEMGCDAVVIGARSERDGAQPGSGWDLLDPGSRTLHATCILYTAPPTDAASGRISLVPAR